MDSRTSAARRLGTLGISAMLLSGLGGCGTQAPPKADESLVKQFAGRGYQTDEHFGIATTFSQWRVGEHQFDIAWTVPVAGNSLPLVIYLPGLGESRTAGEDWRTAWAQAGYAVLSLQLLEADQHVWSSSEAKRGDFVGLAHERYAREASVARLNALRTLLTELRERHESDAAPMRRIDLSRVALAGFDVGAYTAMRAAGELPKDNEASISLPIPIAAIIALSPFADFSGSTFSSRYQAIALPVLSISGDNDVDSYGIVSSSAVRKAPFDHMPSKDAYLLWLTNATHAALSGSAPGGAEPAGSRGDGQASRKGSSRHEGRRGGKGQPGAPDGSGDSGGSAGSDGSPDGGGDRPFGVGRPGGSATSPTQRAISTSLIQGVTTAYLDAYLKQDAIASEWLQRNARRWIGEHGELKRK